MKMQPIHLYLRPLMGALSSLTLLILVVMAGCDDHRAGGNEPTPLALNEYFQQLETILFDTASSPITTAKASIEASGVIYRRQYEAARKLVAPTEVAEAHTAMVAAMLAQAIATEAAARNTPADLPNTNENVNGYAHYTADVGYARDDQSEAGCNLKALADQYKIEFQVLGVCSAVSLPRTEGKSVGTVDAPVNDIYILHEQVTVKTDTGSFTVPNVLGYTISSITAKAGQPINITFDNRNPFPFVFNIAVYAGNDERVKAEQRVGGSLAYSGERVHEITLNLTPGTYTYVDNVHPIAVRGTLTVVK